MNRKLFDEERTQLTNAARRILRQHPFLSEGEVMAIMQREYRLNLLQASVAVGLAVGWSDVATTADAA